MYTVCNEMKKITLHDLLQKGKGDLIKVSPRKP